MQFQDWLCWALQGCSCALCPVGPSKSSVLQRYDAAPHLSEHISRLSRPAGLQQHKAQALPRRLVGARRLHVAEALLLRQRVLQLEDGLRRTAVVGYMGAPGLDCKSILLGDWQVKALLQAVTAGLLRMRATFGQMASMRKQRLGASGRLRQ